MKVLHRFKNSFTTYFGILEIINGDFTIQLNEKVIKINLKDFGFDPDEEVIRGSNHLVEDKFFESVNRALIDNLKYHKWVAPSFKLIIFLEPVHLSEQAVRHFFDVAEMIGSIHTFILDKKQRGIYSIDNIERNWAHTEDIAIAYKKNDKTHLIR